MTMPSEESIARRDCDLRELSLYEPLKIQISEIAAPLFFYLVFGIVQSFRHSEFGWGIVGRWFGASNSQSDYGLIVVCCLVGLIALAANALEIKLYRDKSQPFALGLFGVIPTLANLVLMLFLFYLMGYRGLWSLAEFASGLTFVPILKIIFFTAWGWRGYKAFCHLYQMSRLVRAGNASNLVTYIDKYQLSRFPSERKSR